MIVSFCRNVKGEELIESAILDGEVCKATEVVSLVLNQMRRVEVVDLALKNLLQCLCID